MTPEELIRESKKTNRKTTILVVSTALLTLLNIILIAWQLHR